MNLKSARILISNDDGVEAEGIKLLERIARTLSDDVWVVAPLHEQSGAGHSLSLHKPLRIRQMGERRFAVDGTPTDAVLLGVQEVLKDKRPDLVLSGINRGSNLAEDITYSGTVSAAMEATLLEIPAIAFSNQLTPPSPSGNGGGHGEIDWRVPEHYTADIIRTLAALIPSPRRGEEGRGAELASQNDIGNGKLSPHPTPPPRGEGMDWHDRLINVNFPGMAPENVRGIRVCPQGRRRLGDNLDRRIDPHGRPYIWIGGQRTEPFNDPPDSDFKNIAEGYITITPISLDMTDYSLLDTVRRAVHGGLT